MNKKQENGEAIFLNEALAPNKLIVTAKEKHNMKPQFFIIVFIYLSFMIAEMYNKFSLTPYE